MGFRVKVASRLFCSCPCRKGHGKIRQSGHIVPPARVRAGVLACNREKGGKNTVLFGSFCSGSRDFGWLGKAKLILLSTLILLIMASGCKRRERSAASLEQVVTNRANDKVYIDSLIGNHAEQSTKRAALATVTSRMTTLVERVRGTLPEGADQMALEEALASSEEWQQLVESEKSARAEADKVYETGKEMIRQRMLKEAEDRKAVSEGRARPVERDRQES